VYGDGRIFDITHRYTSDMPSMGSENGLGQFLRLPESMKNGSFANISEMKLITHTGTHVDAPGHYYDHYFDAGFDVDTLDLEVLNGNENILILTYIVVVFCWLNPVFFSLLLMGLWKGIRFVYGRWCVYMRT
jgi:kynurenine formamidase